MKAPSNDIFLLIKSMTKSERRYFRQFSARHTIGEQNQYVTLFDAIDALEEYDEEKLKARLDGSSYVTYFAVAKQYLYQQILESLHQYHLNNNSEEKIKKQLHLAKILIQKKLLQQAESLLKKTRKQVETYTLWEYAAELIAVERRLQRSRKGGTAVAVQASYEALKSILETQLRNNQYWQLSHLIIGMHLENVKVNQPEKLSILHETAQTLLQMDVPADDTAKIDYYKALATYYFMTGEVPKAAEYNRSLLTLFDNHPFLIALEKEQYIAVFNNYLIDNHILGNYELLEEGVARLRKLPTQAIFNSILNLDVKVLELTYSLQLNARIAQRQFASALELLPALEKELKQHQSAIAVNYLLTFHYLSAYINFANARYDATLDCIEAMRNPAFKGLMGELQIAADRLLLLTHYELGNYLLLDNLIQSTRRSRRQQELKSALEDCLFKHLKKLATLSDVKKRERQLQQLKKELNELKSTEGRAWNYFDFDWWLGDC